MSALLGRYMSLPHTGYTWTPLGTVDMSPPRNYYSLSPRLKSMSPLDNTYTRQCLSLLSQYNASLLEQGCTESSPLHCMRCTFQLCIWSRLLPPLNYMFPLGMASIAWRTRINQRCIGSSKQSGNMPAQQQATPCYYSHSFVHFIIRFALILLFRCTNTPHPHTSTQSPQTPHSIP